MNTSWIIHKIVYLIWLSVLAKISISVDYVLADILAEYSKGSILDLVRMLFYAFHGFH